MNSVLGQQWLRMYLDNLVDDAMVRQRWGAQALENFQINRDMVKIAEEGGIDKEMVETEEAGRAPRAREVKAKHRENNNVKRNCKYGRQQAWEAWQTRVPSRINREGQQAEAMKRWTWPEKEKQSLTQCHNRYPAG